MAGLRLFFLEESSMFRRLCILALAMSPVAAFAASKEIQELQRDVALLQESV
jgi:hypothetical protein